eukprot:SAG22_NODE_7960_length_694_cov_2.090756_1_plen_155_part_00
MGLVHRPGDVLSVMPRNSEELGRAFCEIVGWPAETVLLLRPTHPKWAESAMPVAGCARLATAAAATPTAMEEDGVATTAAAGVEREVRTTLLEFVCSSLDIQANPRRKFFQRCAALATDPLHADRLSHFGGPAGEWEFNNYANTEQHTVADTFR